MDIIRICELCRIRRAEHEHHKFSNTKRNRRVYGKRLEHPANKVYACHVCHLNKPIPKFTEKEFLEATKNNSIL